MSPTDGTQPSSPTARVSELGEYIRFNSCGRRFKLSYNNRAAARRLPFFERLFSPLDPVLQQAGNDAEDVWQRQLLESGYRQLAPVQAVQGVDGATRPERTTFETFAVAASALTTGQLGYGREITVQGHVGAFDVHGAIDFVLVEWAAGRPRLRLIEGKSSRKDRTYHRIQLVAYRILLAQTLEADPILIDGHKVTADDIDVAVARIEEDTGQAQALVGLAPLADIEREQADIERLLASDGRLVAIVSDDLDALAYQLDGKCDGCVFNVDCLAESGRQRRLELLGMQPSTAGALRGAGVADIDALAEVDLDGAQAEQLRRQPGFTESLARLADRAKARRSTLPGGDQHPDRYEVKPLPAAGQSQLPEHLQDADALVRVYLAVDYDYTENRIGALSAHLTRTDHELHLGWLDGPRGPQPDPEVQERRRSSIRGDDGRSTISYDGLRRLDGQDDRIVIREMSSPWTGQTDIDTGAEKLLIQTFFGDVVDAIADLAAGQDSCRLHFYVWRRNEITRLVEGCARSDSRLLGSLRQLLGAREGLEQLIFSSVAEEIDGRFGLGWTGRGLVVAASLGWFGQRFHWRRTVRGKAHDLDAIFAQDLFDFKTTLNVDTAGQWADSGDSEATAHRFEVRARNFDTLPAPYWRAMWGTLPTAADLNSPRVAGALTRYERADRTMVRAYLAARVQALRWLEERVVFKNPEIVKTPITVDELPRFDLGVGDVARASIDVLRLDSHVRANGWIAEHLTAVRERIAAGATLPVADVELLGPNRLAARIDLDGFDADLQVMQANWAPDAFVRLTPRPAQAERGQTLRQLTLAGLTCVIDVLDWDAGRVELDVVRAPQTHYILPTASPEWAAERFDLATIDTSPSDFVAGRVEQRLITHANAPAVGWLDPTSPAIPPAPTVNPFVLRPIETAVRALVDDDKNPLADDQADAILASLTGRVSLLQGPPGTGKTATTAVATLVRVMLRHEPGAVLLVGASTHTAVDGLLSRIMQIRPHLTEALDQAGLTLPATTLLRVDPENPGQAPADAEIASTGCVKEVRRRAADSVLIVGATTSKLLKVAHTLRNRFPSFAELVVDEASMMMFPNFLALATLVDREGFIALAGDHRQLAPIMAHDWDHEDRPPVEIYQPHLSAYDAVRRLADQPAIDASMITRSALQLSFRLPPRIVDLVARVYRQDAIELRGLPRRAAPSSPGLVEAWDLVWQGDAGLYLVVHDEHESRKANPVEVQIIQAICAAADAAPPEDIAIVTPHRAQRQMLRAATEGHAGLVDTVERLQGGERSTIIVSGTASDPSAIAASADFVLDLNRSNVAFSRVKDRLIVVCASTLLDHIPADIEQYDQTILWKALRSTCSEEVQAVPIAGATARIMRPPTSAGR